MAKQNYETAESESCNNDIELIYFFKNFIINPLYFSNFRINKHIDVVNYSANGKYDEELISRVIECVGYKRVSRRKLSEGKYLFKDIYQHHDYISKVEIINTLKQEEEEKLYIPPFLITIHDPNKELIDLLTSFCLYNKIKLIVSRIEFAYDFILLSNKERNELYNFMKYFLFMKKSRSMPSEKYKSTYYANNLKKSSKGLKVYHKNISIGERFVRLELTLKRPPVKKLKITPNLDTIDSIDLSKFFSFMSVDEERLMDSLIRKNREVFKNIKTGNNKRFDGLNVRTVISYVNCVLLDKFPLMCKVVDLKSKKKGVENYSRFLMPLDDLTHNFFERTEHQTFLPSIK